MEAQGETIGAPIDVTDGFIHFSTAEQVVETANKHFANQNNLFLISVDSSKLGSDLNWEKSRGGAMFPHLYRTLLLTDVARAQPLPLVDGYHQFPADTGI